MLESYMALSDVMESLGFSNYCAYIRALLEQQIGLFQGLKEQAHDNPG